MKIPKKLWVRLYAGMGDFYKRYFWHPTWKCLEDLKTKNPDVEITALLVSQTIPALEFVDYHPCLDKLVKPKMHIRELKKHDITKYVGDATFLGPGLAKKFICKTPPIYLSKQDKEFVKNITSQHKKYICIHPFSGDRYGLNTRTPLLVQQYIPIIDALVAKGYSVFLMGKNWDRINLGSTKPIKINENIPWGRVGMINLINKTNARTSAELIRLSSGFVGTASSMMCAAWSMGGIKTTILTPKRWKEPIETMPWAKDKINDPNHQVLYLDGIRTPQRLGEIANVTANWF